MSKEKRVKERAAWRELQIVISNYKALGRHCSSTITNFTTLNIFLFKGFEYLIKRPSQNRVCFGSVIERDACTLKISKMNALMRRILPKPLLRTSQSSPPLSKKVLCDDKITQYYGKTGLRSHKVFES